MPFMSAYEDPLPLPAKTTLGVPMDSQLRERVKAAAETEKRTEANFARYYLERAADEVLGAPTEEAAP